MTTRIPSQRELPASDTGFDAAPGILLLLSCLLTAVVAHTQAGGGSPGPGGLLATVLALAPVAAVVNRLARGPVGLALAGLIGQLVAHVSLSLVTPSHSMATHTAELSSSSAAHGAHHQMPVPSGVIGWSFPDAVFGHIAHMGAAMASAHAIAAVITAGLVAAGLGGLRRAAGRVLTVVLRFLLPTPLASISPKLPPRIRPSRADFLVVLSGRAPPTLS